MTSIRTEIDIAAPTDVVWDVLTDLEGHAAWDPFVVEAAGDVRPGARLRLRIVPPGSRGMVFRPRVVEVVEGRSFAWLGRLGVRGLFDGLHRFELHPLPGGRTRLVQSETFRGVLVPLLRRTLASSERGFRALDAALAQQAESRAAALAAQPAGSA
jgi:hypothetical protein